MKKQFITYCLLLTTLFSFSQYNESYKCYPQNWWAGMKMNNIQLMIYGDAIKNATNFTINYAGIKIKKITRLESYNYAFIDISIAPNTKPGIVKIIPKDFTGTDYIKFEIKAREKGSGTNRVKGVTSEDLIYLLMPDRFSNGDVSNDFYTDLRDTGHDRSNPFDRHGGDLQGVINHLDYIKDLGATTIWMTPVVENDMARTQEGGTSRSTYHGYAFTNQYKIDKRFGGNDAYKNLVDAAHKKGLKIIQDAVYNHIGEDHFLMKDLPAKDWLNNWDKYTNTSYKDQALPDVYASNADRDVAVKGWFTPFLADLNQANPLVSKFLIQYAIWATEEFGIDGWRIDTYFYSDANFLNDINTALYKEFPKLTVFGEAWVNSVANSAYFCENNLQVPFKHNAQGVTDFPFLFSTIAAFNENFGWNDGVNKFYQTVAQDYLYKNSFRNCIFLGNHDLDRIFSVLGEDVRKMKAAHTLLLTHRGIPQIYYGDELLVKNFKNPTDAEVRKDFPGGWAGDAINKFEASGRTVEENDFFNYFKKLANYRKNSEALTKGKLTHYLPNDGVYVYFRYTNKQKIMIVINTTKDAKIINLNRFGENLIGAKQLKDIFSNASKPLADITLEGYRANVFEVIN
jgi:neopullulanase